MSERDALSSRAIPFMELSDGSAASLTAPPPPLPHYLNAEGRAMARFAVEGNAISKYYHRHHARLSNNKLITLSCEIQTSEITNLPSQ
jgi:hypothetical protein